MLVRWNSLFYREALILRNRVLKESAGKPYLFEAPIEEKQDIHLVVRYGEEVVGTLLLHPVSSSFVQIKQVAIDPLMQGKRLGKKLMIYAEEVARRLGFSTIFLTGRKQAWGFYDKLAYQELPYEYQEDQLILKVFKKEIRQPLSRITTKEMKTNGRQ